MSKFSFLFLWLFFDGIFCAMKPIAGLKNSFGDFELARDPMSAGLSQEVVGKLGEIATVLKNGYQTNFEVASKYNLEMIGLIKTQETRIIDLESKLNKILKEFSKVDEERELVATSQDHLESVEQRLNETINENQELKNRIRDLSIERANTNESESVLVRSPRNYLSTPVNDVVAFDAFRNKPFHTAQSFMNFDGVNVNAGNAFDPNSGTFRAPRAGVYIFNFHALTQDGRATYVKIVHNGKNVAGTYRRHEGEGDESHLENLNSSLRRAEGMLAQSVILNLEKGDEVQVYSYHGNMRDGGWHYTHFNGFLIQ